MKRIKNILCLLIALIILSATSVNALSYKFNYNGKEFTVNEDDTSITVSDFMKKIEKEINVSSSKQIWGIIYDGYFSPYINSQKVNELSTDEVTYIYEKKEIKDKLTINSIEPTNIDEAYAIFESIMNEYKGYNIDANSCNEFFTVCNVEDISLSKTIENVKIDYNYDTKLKNNVNEIIKKLNGKTSFALKDLELLNFWLNGGSAILYSDEFKSLIDYKNFYLDIRLGAGDELTTSTGGVVTVKYNGIIYHVIPELTVDSINVFYVDNDTETSKIKEAIQNKFNKFTKNKITVNNYKTLGEYISDKTDEINNNPWIVEKETQINALQKFYNYSSDNNVYSITIGNEIHYFLVKKDTSKIYTPKLITNDLETNIIISTDNTSIPLDTLISVNELTSGDEYNKIKKILNTEIQNMFDLKLYSNAQNKYIKKLDNGTFEVRIPINNELKNKELVVYYVDENNNKQVYDVTIKDGYAIFNTNHFSIYTLAEKSSSTETKTPSITKEEKKEDIKNPATSDNITYYLILTVISILGIVLSKKLLKNN